MSDKPIIFDDNVTVDVETDTFIDGSSTAMGILTRRSSRRTGWLGRLMIAAMTALLGMIISVAFWDFVTGLRARNALISEIVIGLGVIIIVISLIYLIREMWALLRLRQTENLREDVKKIYQNNDLTAAQKIASKISELYPDQTKALGIKFSEGREELVDGVALLMHCERSLLLSRDQLATSEIELRTRRVALITAFVPIAMADLIAVLSTNIGMVRTIAEIYGGRPGIIGGWRLFGKIARHLVATGAVAIGDDIIGSVMGGSLLTKLSRRFGEGVINGALTARVGIATMEVCRPMEFHALKRPATGNILSHALSGIISSGSKEASSKE